MKLNKKRTYSILIQYTEDKIIFDPPPRPPAQRQTLIKPKPQPNPKSNPSNKQQRKCRGGQRQETDRSIVLWIDQGDQGRAGVVVGGVKRWRRRRKAKAQTETEIATVRLGREMGSHSRSTSTMPPLLWLCCLLLSSVPASLAFSTARATAARHPQTRIAASATGEDDDSHGSDDDAAVAGVTLKMAFDASPSWGVADLSETKSERFTSPASLDMVHRLRRASDAVLVGRATVERDDCSLTVRRVALGEGGRQPVRVVLDPSSRLGCGKHTLLNDGLPTIVYHLHDADADGIAKAACDSVAYVGLRPSDRGSDGSSSLCPLEVVKDLAARGLRHVMVEGGPATARAFLEARAVDRAILVRAPVEFEIPVPALMDEETLKRAGLYMVGTAVMGGDSVEYWTRDGFSWPTSDLPMWP